MVYFLSNAGVLTYVPNWERKSRFIVGLKWDVEDGAPLATLFAQVALFAASLCLKKTRLCSEYDHSGMKTAILYHICAVLLCYANRWNRLEFLRRSCGIKVNSIANLICLILGILLEKFYENSLASLCFALIMTILFLILLVIIQPRTDLGFFGFLVGATVSVAYSLFQLKLGTWVVFAICFVLLACKFWLDKNWLELEEREVMARKHYRRYLNPIDLSRSIARRLSNQIRAPVIQSIDALIVAGFYLVWVSALLGTNCLNSESCTSCSAMEMLKCGAIYVLWMSPALIHRVYSLFQVEFWVLWPKTMPYTEAIHRVEHTRNKIKRLKEACHPKNADVVEKAMIEEMGLLEFLSMTLGSYAAKQELPKWVRNRMKKRFFKTRQDIEAFYARHLKLKENQNQNQSHVIEINLDTPSN